MSFEATNWAWEQENIRPTQKLVLLSLANRANKLNQCFPSIGRISEDTLLNRKTVSAALKVLREKNLIKKTEEYKGKNKCVPVYELLVKTSQKNKTASSPNSGVSPNWDTAPKQPQHLSLNREKCHTQKRDTESIIELVSESIRKEVSSETLFKLEELALEFQKGKKEDPECNRLAPPVTNELIKNCIESTASLLTMENGFSFEEIQGTVHWANKHPFWSKNLLSLNALIKKNADGLCKFQTIYAQKIQSEKQPKTNSAISYSGNYGDGEAVIGLNCLQRKKG